MEQTRGGAGESYTFSIKTAASTQVAVPVGATVLVYSRGSVPATTLDILEKGNLQLNCS